MSQLYTIKDERTVYCRAAMKANGGEWNPVTREWIFHDASDHANAAAELYRVTRATNRHYGLRRSPKRRKGFSSAGPRGNKQAALFQRGRLYVSDGPVCATVRRHDPRELS
jgi:hypothetical protein